MTRDEAARYAFAELHQTFFDALHALMAKVDARARAEEQEACARVCEQKSAVKGGEIFAARIRARGANVSVVPQPKS